jgi:plasmid maintenance system killer protein
LKVVFINEELERLYERGRSRKYRLDEGTIKRYSLVVRWLQVAVDIYDLWKQPSLKFEKLQGYERRYSARVTLKYRLEMEIDWEDSEQTVGIIGIIDLSKHYGG